MPVVGFLHPGSPDTNADRLRAFRLGLKDAGYVEGENVTIEFRWAESQIDRLPELAGELVRQKVAVIVAPQGTASALAAKTATTTIPIVFNVSEDPVRIGLVASLARPGGNLTGINFFSGELVQKRLELLRELVPGAARIAVLVNPANAPNTETTLREVERAALAIGLQIVVLKTSTSREINAAFATLVSLSSAATLFHQPAGAHCRLDGASRGPRGMRGVRSVSMPAASSRAPSRRTCRSCSLRGSSWSSTAETARMLRLTVPPTLLARADEVIE
jgi:putative ABC transport system substrate-binding protein